MNNTANQNRDGVFLRFSDLGVANNAVIYGYSLFPPDVVVSPAANLVNYSDATNFPTTSDLSNGGLDQIAVSGLWITTNAHVVLAETIDDLSATVTGREVRLNWTLPLMDNVGSLTVRKIRRRQLVYTAYKDRLSIYRLSKRSRLTALTKTEFIIV